jgi:hypothetical protein
VAIFFEPELSRFGQHVARGHALGNPRKQHRIKDLDAQRFAKSPSRPG